MTLLGNQTQLFKERKECPLCASRNFDQLRKHEYESEEIRQFFKFAETFKHDFWSDFDGGIFNGQHFEIVKCHDCSFVFQPSVLNDVGMKLLYDKWVDPDATLERHNQLGMAINGSLDRSRRLSVLLSRFSDAKNIEMLDWGGGFGDFCVMAKGFGIDMHALEFSDERAHHLESRGIHVVRSGELEKKHYHFINLDQVLEHITDPVKLLREIREHLRDDGILYVGTPRCGQIEKLVRDGPLSQRVFKCLSLQHINAFTNKTLKKACTAAGYKVLFSTAPVPVLYDRKNWRPSMKDTVKNFGRPFSQFFRGTGFFCKKSANQL